MKISAPIPLDARQGSSVRRTCLPAKPTTSSISTAATSGLPKMVAIAAAEPATATGVAPCGDSRSLVRLAASRARPPPNAISGASGPTTAPSTRLKVAARSTPVNRWCGHPGGRQQQDVVSAAAQDIRKVTRRRGRAPGAAPEPGALGAWIMDHCPLLGSWLDPRTQISDALPLPARSINRASPRQPPMSIGVRSYEGESSVELAGLSGQARSLTSGAIQLRG